VGEAFGSPIEHHRLSRELESQRKRLWSWFYLLSFSIELEKAEAEAKTDFVLCWKMFDDL